VLCELLRDSQISQARVEEVSTTQAGEDGKETKVTRDTDGFVMQTCAEEMEENLAMLHEPVDDEEDDESSVDEDSLPGGGDNAKRQKERRVSRMAKVPKLTTVAFQIQAKKVETVKRQVIELDYPLMKEYDFRNAMDLKPHTRIRRYQERLLAKMFRGSGIVVLLCGAEKTLMIKKSGLQLRKNGLNVTHI